jgi:glycosyltransferase involved in cell wall biosynthesis
VTRRFDAPDNQNSSALKVLYLNPSGELGGAEHSLLDLLATLRAGSNFSLEVIASADGPFVAAAQALGVGARALPFPDSVARVGDTNAAGAKGGPAALRSLRRMCLAFPGICSYLVRLRREIAASSPDLIHTNGFKMHLLAIWARSRRTPVIWHIRDYVSSRPLMARLLPAHSARCAGAIANSKSVAADLRKLCPDLPVHTVYNDVDLARFSAEGTKLDLDKLAAMPGAEPGTMRVGMVATMARWKGHEVFLRALSLLAQMSVARAAVPAFPAIRGYIIGGPLYQTLDSQYSIEELRAITAQLGLSAQVGFTGYVNDPASAMRALDIVVHASTEPEPFGRVIAEAMACGKPVIAAGAGGALEIISDGIDALVHPPGDAAALARQIARLAAEPELRQRLSHAAAATICARFTPQRLAGDVVRIYNKVAADGLAISAGAPA